MKHPTLPYSERCSRCRGWGLRNGVGNVHGTVIPVERTGEEGVGEFSTAGLERYCILSTDLPVYRGSGFVRLCLFRAGVYSCTPVYLDTAPPRDEGLGGSGPDPPLLGPGSLCFGLFVLQSKALGPPSLLLRPPLHLCGHCYCFRLVNCCGPSSSAGSTARVSPSRRAVGLWVDRL